MFPFCITFCRSVASKHEAFLNVNLTSVAVSYFERNVEGGGGNEEVILRITKPILNNEELAEGCGVQRKQAGSL